jgi:hypothetical protein
MPAKRFNPCKNARVFFLAMVSHVAHWHHCDSGNSEYNNNQKCRKIVRGDLMEFQEYIKPELLILVPVLYVIGMILKNTERVDDRYIPAILGEVGMVLAMLWAISTEGLSGIGVFTGMTQGILAAGMAVYTNQLVKQSRKGQ